MPLRPSRGLAVPGRGERLKAPSKVLDGPKRCSQDSAMTCGAIINGSSSRKPSVRRPGKSVMDKATAKGAPITSASNAPKKDVSRVLNVARMTAGLERRLAKAVRSTSPPGAMAVDMRRSTGTRLSRKMTTRTARLESRVSYRSFRHRIERKPASRDAGCSPGADRLGNSQRALLPHNFAEFFLVRRVVRQCAGCVERQNLDGGTIRITCRKAGIGTRRDIAHADRKLLAFFR